jgi:tetratricopeptide (TPR) repeat protein
MHGVPPPGTRTNPLMSYPGNPALSADAQQRILGTFEQTLDLAEQGSRQEALLGCDFVLRMDPHFEPARRLLERLQAAPGAVRVDDLKGSPAGLEEDSLPDLDSLDFDILPLEDDLSSGFAGNGGGAAGSLRAELEELLAARRFQDFLTRAQSDPSALSGDPELQKMAELAQERLEAEPYINKFLGKAREALRTGQRDEVARLLDKARSLDATHPGIAGLESDLDRLSAGASPAPPTPQKPVELPPALRPTATPPPDLFGASGGGGDSESERRIAQLLAEGQTAFDAGDPQAAIDAWSRIFLIDIDHQEAARRIELARKLKAENERQVEEIFHDGLSRLEAGDLAAARQAFEKVLVLQPSYLAAREYLQQIDAGEVPMLAPRPPGREPARPSGSATAPAAGGDALSMPDLPEVPADLKEEILVPPEPGAAPARGERRERREPGRPAARESRGGKRFLYIGGAVLVVVLLAGGVLYLKWDSFFPNLPSDRPTPGAPAAAPAVDPIRQATELHDRGRVAVAIAQLKRLSPGNPRYAEAQRLIAQWAEAPAGGPAPALGTEAITAGTPGTTLGTAGPATLPTEAAAHRQELIEAGRRALAQGNDLYAANYFEQAAAIAKLEGADADQLSQTQRRLQPLAEQVKLFKQHDWEYILPALWRMREANPDNHAVNRLIVDSYYNLGIRDLQRADAAHAASQFAEALKIEPGDATLRRHYLFAQTYQQRPQDLLFRIYVKYLPYR